MVELTVILQKILVKEFYRRNTGFFLVVFFLGFGIQQPPSMLVSPAFLIDVAGEPIFILAVLILFFLYFLKCFNFMQKTIRAKENEYILVASLLPRPAVLVSLGQAFIQLFLPALAYCALVAFYGYMTQNYWVIGVILIYNIGLIFFTIFYFYRQLTQTIPENNTGLFTLLHRYKINLPAFTWPLAHILRQEKVMLFLTKILSCGVLLAFVILYPYLEYGIRPTQIGFLMALTVHCMMVQNIQRFQEIDLHIFRNLPFSFLTRLRQQSILFAILLLPELLLLIRYLPFPDGFLYVLLLLFFGISFLLFCYALVYFNWVELESYIRFIFFLFFTLLFSLLGYVPIYILSSILMAAAIFLYQKWYYRFELKN